MTARPFRRPVRAQAEVLLRAFEAGAFDDLAVDPALALEGRKARREAFGRAALDRAEGLLGAALLPATPKALRLALVDDDLGRPPSFSSWDVPEALLYRRWLLAADLGKALGARKGAGR